MTAGDRRDIVSITCEKGLFLLSGYGVRGADPSTCGTQGGSGRPSTVTSSAFLRSLDAGGGRRQAVSGVFFMKNELRPLSNKKGGAEQMAAKAGARIKITLRCSECKQRNYNTFKNKKNTPDRLELNKYCPFCRKHTVHNETK